MSVPVSRLVLCVSLSFGLSVGLTLSHSHTLYTPPERVCGSGSRNRSWRALAWLSVVVGLVVRASKIEPSILATVSQSS